MCMHQRSFKRVNLTVHAFCCTCEVIHILLINKYKSTGGWKKKPDVKNYHLKYHKSCESGGILPLLSPTGESR